MAETKSTLEIEANKDNIEGKRMTKQFFKTLLRSDFKNLYTTESLNDILYLHCKGFCKIENMEGFTGLKCVYLEGNAFEKIEGLDNCTQLRSLYLHENVISKIEGLDKLVHLTCLNLSDNCIQKIEGLDNNKELQNLLLSRNRIGVNGPEDYEYISTLKSVSVLDVANNRIDHEDPEAFIKILEGMENLAVLYLTNNPIIKKIPNYRKTLIARLPKLKYLDDRPVFAEDRRYAEAFHKGGMDAEREERAKVKQEEEDRQEANHRYFKEFVEQARKEREEKDRLARGEAQDNSSSDIDPKNLDTYYSSSKGTDSQKGEDSSSLNKSRSEKDRSDAEDHSHSDTSSQHGDDSKSKDGSIHSEENSKSQKTAEKEEKKKEEEQQFPEYMNELD